MQSTIAKLQSFHGLALAASLRVRLADPLQPKTNVITSSLSGSNDNHYLQEYKDRGLVGTVTQEETLS